MMKRARQGFLPCFIILSLLVSVARSQGAFWTEGLSPAPDNALYAVAFADRTDAWAVGDTGTILRLVGGQWQNFTSGTDRDLLGLAVWSDEAWAVGDIGTILRFDGRAWRPHADSQKTTLLPLHAVGFLNPSNGWAVGGRPAEGPVPAKGVVLHFNGASWTSATLTSEPIYDLALNASDDIHFCGGSRFLMHFDGSEFVPVVSPVAGPGAWRAMGFPFRTQGWVVGDGGKIGRFTVGAWIEQASPTTRDLLALAILNERRLGYAVGEAGTRLHFYDGGFILDPPGAGNMPLSKLHSVALANELEGAAVGYQPGVTVPRLGRIFMFRNYTQEEDLNRIRVYPNPYVSGKGRPVTFDLLPADVSMMEIVSILGEVIADLNGGVDYESLTGVATWNGRLRSGSFAATGAYVVRIRTASGFSRRAVFLVTRR